MLPKIFAAGVIMCCSFCSSAQTLFTFGNHSVSKQEFLKAYKKNNSDSAVGRMSPENYLNLYAIFRMKVQAALDAKMDTSADQHSELLAFRDQLAEGFLREDASMKLMVDEAIQRSRKDIYLTHIYVPAKAGSTNEELATAEAKIKKIYSRLQKGESFDKLFAENNGTALGYITAFVLPYDIENIIYGLAPGQYSVPYQSGAGFHIFRNAGERKAVGKVRVAQILLAYPPEGPAESDKNTLAKRADSIYNALKKGASFTELVAKLSTDNLSYQAGGQLPIFGVGQYDTLFEKQAFALANDSDISKPFVTSFGYHILKRIQRIPPPDDASDREVREAIKEKVLQSDRMQVAQQMLIKNVRETIRKDASPKILSSDSATLAFYRNHLERYSPEFADQMKEFREGNLLFAIMQKNVWDAAATDSNALVKYYIQHKDKYWWENSADALIVSSPSRTIAWHLEDSMSLKWRDWRKMVAASNGSIQVDSGRFELSQIPVAERTSFKEGLITAPVSNGQDSSTSFAYIIRLYTAHEPKNYEDAKGSVINDYQTSLEERWIADLKKKYPLKINNEVLRTVNQ